MQIIKILLLRLKQIARASQKIGFPLLFLALVISGGIVLQFVEFALNLPSYFSLVAAFGILAGLDFNRNDKIFLNRILKNSSDRKLLLSLEYFLLISPLVIVQVLLENYMIAALLFLVSPIVAMISPYLKRSIEKRFKKSVKIIPLEFYELRFHVEKRKYVYLLFYLVFCLGVIHVGFFIVGGFFLGVLILDSFKEIEPIEMLNWRPSFVRQKVLRYLFLVAKFIAFPVVLSIAFNWDYYLIMLYVVFVLLCYTCLAISYKYSNYSPVFKSKINETALAAVALVAVLPGGIIITLAFTIYHYFHSEKVLRTYYA